MSFSPIIKEFHGYFNEYIGEAEDVITQGSISQAQINFILAMIAILQQHEEDISPSDTILTYETDGCVVPIIRMKNLDNISLFLYIADDLSCIMMFWGKIDTLDSSYDLEMGYCVSCFNKKDDAQWLEHTLASFAQELKGDIQISSIAINNSPVEIQYHIKNKNRNVKIGSRTLTKFSFSHLFKAKTKRTFRATFSNKTSIPNDYLTGI